MLANKLHVPFCIYTVNQMGKQLLGLVLDLYIRLQRMSAVLFFSPLSSQMFYTLSGKNLIFSQGLQIQHGGKQIAYGTD